MKQQILTVTLDTIVGGGQAIGTLDSGKKAFVWGALPGETVTFRITKKKSKLVEGVIETIEAASPARVKPRDPESYLSTSPWQIMSFETEQHYKAALIEEAFELHDIVLPEPIELYSDGLQYEYRNKVEFSWYGDVVDGSETLDLAFFRRGSKGKIAIKSMSLARPEIMACAIKIRDQLAFLGVPARNLKTLLIRCDRLGNCVWQLYVKEKTNPLSEKDVSSFGAQGGEVIYSDPRSPASRITQRLATYGDTTLQDSVRGVDFQYAAESFFQVNLPVYEQSLSDMQTWVQSATTSSVLDLYSGVGTIGLTIGGSDVTLVEIDEYAVREMRRNVKSLDVPAKIVHSSSEQALDFIDSSMTIIVDPPRAGLHADVVKKLLDVRPARIIYLSCNPVTQARDVALLAESYGIRYHRGYNFFPRTPHIEHLVVLDLKP